MQDNIKDVVFDEATHTYTYRGKTLKGITSAIAKSLGKKYDQFSPAVQLACSYGSQVHKQVQDWIDYDDVCLPTLEQACWIVDWLAEAKVKDNALELQSEVRVSDFKGTASNVDIVEITNDGIVLYDIKTGNFDRQYCTLQLNAYRVLYEQCYGTKVKALKVLNSKTKRVFTIKIGYDTEVQDLLKSNIA